MNSSELFLSFQTLIQHHTTILLSGSCEDEKALAVKLMKAILLPSFQNYPQLEKHLYNDTFPNALYLEPKEGEGQIPINTLKNNLSKIQNKPALEGPRIIWLNKLEACNHFGWNALLKLLEEPPVNTFLILRTLHYGRVIPTIRSRCFHLALPFMNQIASEDVEIAIQTFLKCAYKGYFSQLQSLSSSIIKLMTDEKIIEAVLLKYLSKDQSPRGCETYFNVHKFLMETHQTHLDPMMRLMSVASYVAR